MPLKAPTTARTTTMATRAMKTSRKWKEKGDEGREGNDEKLEGPERH
jgi:hypothetical protein